MDEEEMSGRAVGEVREGIVGEVWEMWRSKRNEGKCWKGK